MFFFGGSIPADIACKLPPHLSGEDLDSLGDLLLPVLQLQHGVKLQPQRAVEVLSVLWRLLKLPGQLVVGEVQHDTLWCDTWWVGGVVGRKGKEGKSLNKKTCMYVHKMYPHFVKGTH